MSSDEASERIAKEIGVISKDDTAVHDTTSQSDGRPTAIAVGAGACIFMAVALCLLIVLDLATITSHLKLMKKNLSWMFSRNTQPDPSLISSETESFADLQNNTSSSSSSHARDHAAANENNTSSSSSSSSQ